MAAQKSPVHFEIQISVNLSDFQQIQVKFHQLFAKVNEVKPWKSLENYQIYRLFDERERKKGRKKLFLAETAKNLQKVPKEKLEKGVPAKNLQILWREMNALVKRSGLSPNKPYFGRFGQKVPKSAKWENLPKKNFFKVPKKV